MRFSSHPLSIAALAVALSCAIPPVMAKTGPQEATPAPAGRVLGTITAISGSALTIKSDAGAESQVTVGDSTRMVRTAPGEKSLSGATPIQLTDLEVGDRVLVRAAPGEAASLLIAMKQTDIAQRQQQQREDWQKRGISGLVKQVDPATGNIIVNTAAGSAARLMTIQTTSATVIRQYAPDSVKFDAAKISSLSQLKPGDQLRARGERAGEPDQPTCTAEEIVFGSFRNVAGTLTGVDAKAQTVTVLDLATKKPVIVHLNAESQIHKLSPEMAQTIAMRLKPRVPPQGPQSAAGSQSAQSHMANAVSTGATYEHGGQLRMSVGQMLQEAPSTTLADLHKGDAVMIVASDSTPNEVTAITLLSGVEPLLQASAGASESAFSAWSLGGGQEAANSQQQQ